jgi:hypothetical protein
MTQPSSVFSKTHHHSSYGYMGHHYDHLDGDRANEGTQKFSGLIQMTTVFISFKMFFAAMQYLKLLQK